MNYNQLTENIKKKRSFLCVGLDTDINLIPEHLKKDSEFPVFEFNKAIIDSTHQYAVAYKPNTAFYESDGELGWTNLRMTIGYLRANYPDIFLIADAKRGDIGNTSKMYAQAFLQNLNFDAITVAPYMGEDSVMPFLSYEGKWVILLALTSNAGSKDFQMLKEEGSSTALFENVLKKSQQWGNAENMMYVVGATKAEMLTEIRKLVPNHFLLVPGIGAQGGSLEDVARYGMNSHCGLLVNNSRSIIYAERTENFAQAAGLKALEMQQQMKRLLAAHGVI